MIILIRHAQSEGNKNREIHQLIPDHRVKLTEDGWVQVDAPFPIPPRSSNEAVIN
jgi:broad specificity phosphatase PhoE